ncbi:hypothetical protein WL93_24090 [Burkholderia diffusa]|uniref:adenylyl-sulfate kinase n=1 Tax=Burkholderia diffusa TaxID=488732 RepID=UPI00075F4AF4|nr:adenylyl-sulfate kinase [Burkholderia diffusa]KWF80454.1 hypothetical protein WL93_24090 [Burkholderia diffusa]
MQTHISFGACCYWFTGLPTVGKSTLANAFAVVLHERGIASTVLDDDQLREGLNWDLDFSRIDRTEAV